MPEAIAATCLKIQGMNPTGRINGMKGKPETGQSPKASRDSDELKHACAEFESLFIFHLLKEMRSTIPKIGLLTGGRDGELYTSLFDAQIAREMASERGIGVSTLLMERLKSTSAPEEKSDGRE